jgi:hypothetical protein
LEADTPAPAPIQVSVDNTVTGYGQYRIVNAGQETVFLGVGATAAQATARAAAIVNGILQTLGQLPTSSGAWPLVVKIKEQASEQVPKEGE